MKYINKFQENIGGIAKIWAVSPDDITSITLNKETNISTLALETTSNIYQIHCVDESIQYREQEKQSDSGNYFECELTGIVLKDTPEVNLALDALTERKWLVIYQDQNENYKLIGIVINPLRFKSKLATGKNISDRNHHEISFLGFQPNRSVFINNPF